MKKRAFDNGSPGQGDTPATGRDTIVKGSQQSKPPVWAYQRWPVADRKRLPWGQKRVNNDWKSWVII